MTDDRQREQAATIKVDVDDVAAAAVDQTIGRYKLLEKVGEGGCGVVYVAEQTEPVRRRVALKVIKLGMDTKQVVARFEAERQALALMDHPNIAKVLDAGTTEQGRPYFVMELVRGIWITDYCDQNNLPTEDRLDLCLKVCQAIQHAHQKGIIHRDIKPSNILVTLHDGVPVPKVIDFGIAKATEGRLTDATVYTQLHQFIGTPAYMSPEQAEMSGLDIDTRSDIYSLGVLLYELLVGSTPFDAKELMASGIDAMRKTIREKEPLRPSTKLAALPGEELTTTAKRRSSEAPKLITLLRGDLDWVVMKCLEKDRTRRYESASGLAADLKRHLNHEPVVARPPSAGYRAQKFVRRNRVLVTAAGVIAAVLVLGVAVSAWQAVRATRARQQAHAEAVRAQQAEKNATEKSVIAETQRQRAEAYLYDADMVLAQHALDINNLGRVRELLDKYQPTTAGRSSPGSRPAADLRGWEWRYLWGCSRGDELYTLGSHKRVVDCVVFSDDGTLLATSSQDNTVKIWDMAARRELAAVRFAFQPSDLCFVPQSRTVAVAGGDEIRLLDGATGKKTGEIAFDDDVGSLAYSHDGNRLAVHQGRTLEMLHTRGRRQIWRTTMPAAWRLAFSPDNTLLAAVTEEAKVLLLDAANGQQLASLPGFRGGFLGSLVFSPDGALLACASWETGPIVRIYDAQRRQELRVLELQEGRWFGGLAFSPDGKLMAVGGAPHVITLVDVQSWQVAGHLQGHLDEAWALAFSPDGKTLVSTSKDTTVRVWNPDLHSLKRFGNVELTLPSDADAFRLSTDGGKLCALTTNQTFAIWETATLSQLSKGPLPFTNILHTAAGGWTWPWAISSDGRRLFNLTRTGQILIWDPVTRESVVVLETNVRGLEILALSPDETRLAVGGTDGIVRLWDLQRQTLVTNLPAGPPNVLSLVFSPDSQLLGVGFGGGPLEAWRLRDARRLLSSDFHTMLAHTLAISPNQRFLAAAGVDAKLTLWDLEQGTLLKAFTGALNSYNCVAISHDSRRVFAGGGPGTLSVWDTDFLQSVGTFRGHRRSMGGLSMLPDGNTVVSVGWDSGELPAKVRLWRAPSSAEIDAVEKAKRQP